MSVRIPCRSWAAAALLLVWVEPALAEICPATPGDAYAFLAVDAAPASRCPALPVVRWADPNVVFECDFFLDADKQVACGGLPATCAELCRTAASEWNAELAGHFSFIDADASTPVGFCLVDGLTSISGGTRDCAGGVLGPTVLAVALRQNFIPTGQLVDSDITVNQAFTFTRARFQATLGHEFGHVIGLDHPNQCDDDFNVLMRSASMFSSTDPCFVRGPTEDDVSGALLIYPEAMVVCGDADGDGDVTDADGVQVLRIAAGLSSRCTLETCDVNGDGVINDVDAVNVFRRAAAALSFSSACPL